MNKDKKKPNVKKIICRVAIGLVIFFAVQWIYAGWRFNFGPMKFLGEIRLKGMPGNSEEYDFSHIEPIENSPLQGKTVLFLGSSVTEGAAALYQSIPEYFVARMGCTAIKEAVGGTTLCDTGKSSYIQRMLNNVDKNQQIDLLVCQLSTNDASRGMPLGEFGDDTSTITGAMEYIINYAAETWGCPVVFYTNALFNSDAYSDMVARLYEISDKYKLGVLDLWSDDAFNAISDEQRALYMQESIHPFKAGYRDWWGPEMEKQMLIYWEQ